MNDLMYGREQPRNPMTCYGFTDASDTLEWQPAGLDPAALPSVTGGDGISSALEAWGGLCCKQENLPPGDRSGLGLCTALTLLHLVSGLAGRVQRLLPLQEPHCGAGSEKQALWYQLAASLATLCGVPEKGMLQLRALCCWAVQQQVTAGQLQPQQQRQAQMQAPLLVTGKVPLLAAYRAHVKAGRSPLLGVLLVHVPAGTPLSAVLGPGGDVTGGGMNTHLVDVLGFDSTEGELSFLLPPDHELGSGYTVLSLVSQTSGEKMSKVIPLQCLRTLPFTAPPPAWLAGLQGLLHYPIDSGTAGTNTSGSSQDGLELSSGLVLRRLAEHADRFELEFVVGDELGGTVTSSGLQLDFPDAPAGGGACRQLQLTLKEPAKLRGKLSLPWPVDSSTAKVRVRRSTRTISATLPKHLLWPGDSAWLSKVAVDSLPAWGQGSDNSDELSTLLAMMFSHPELQAKSRGVTLGGGGMSSMYDVKESVQALFVRTYLDGTHVHQLRCGSAGPRDEPELTVLVHGGGVKRLPDGRPLLHLSYVDHVSTMRQFPTEASHSAPMRRFSKIMRFLSAAGRGPVNTVNCTADELRLLRFILARNAAAMLVPSWQAKLLELPSEWHASYLVPLFTDFLGLSEGPKLIDQLKDQLIRWRRSASRQLPGPRRRATAVTPQLGAGGGAQAARAAVLQHKAAGNALFKQRRYAAAVDEYQAGLQALQLVLLDVVATGTGLAGNLPELMSLKADLSNNTAMALIKQAESGPSAARANCLAQALKECTAVIDMDASNSKALYRRALVHHKMGNISAAQQDLSKLPAGGEDAAVESLRRQLEAAL